MEARHASDRADQRETAASESRKPFSRFTRDRLAEIDAQLDEHADWGLFGPESVTWKIHSHPITIVGGFRALMIQALHPLAMAGVTMYSDFKTDPLGRFRRTAQYVHHVVFSDTDSAHQAAARVRKVHDHVRGTDPVTGREFSANDPETLLWVHCAQTYSFLVARREFVGDLTEEEEERYLKEFVVAGELMGIPTAMIPSSRLEYREYFGSMLPHLCASKEAVETIAFVAKPDLRLVSVKDWPFAVNLKWAGHAAATLMPRSLRQMSGLQKPGRGDWALRRWTAVNAKAMDRALGYDSIANTFDQFAAKKMGTSPVPRTKRD
ncbi:MAG: DUF2236 domain-containing protein [Thermoleophilaceae bacterium]|nr:DUF2236 domain-containing protein [Thermoleophilaceae bacterium]